MSKPRSWRPPDPYEEAIEQRLKELKMTRAQYFTSLVSFDLSIAKPHTFTGDFHNLPGPQRDAIYTEIARAYLSGEALGGSWAAARIKDAVKEAAIPEAPSESRIAQKFRERLLKKDQKPKNDDNPQKE